MSAPLTQQLLNVLDIADAQATRQAAERQRLLDATQSLDTPHSPETLAQAVDTHLAQTLTVAPTALPTLFDFGWDRPKDPVALTAQRETSRMARWGKQSGGPSKRSPLSRQIFNLGYGIGIAGMVVGFCFMGSNMFAAAVPSFLGGVMAFFGITTMAVRIDKQVDAYADQLPQYELGMLSPMLQKDCLAQPTTRAYLRAVLDSELPQLLRGDLDRLDALLAAQRMAEKRERDQLRRQEEQQKYADQMTQLRHALRTGSEPTSTAS
jgi:hypothetical protein